jgi:hypothetical protein
MITAEDVRAILENAPPTEMRYFIFFESEAAKDAAHDALDAFVTEWDADWFCEPSFGGAIMVPIDVTLDGERGDAFSCALDTLLEGRGGAVTGIYAVEKEEWIWTQEGEAIADEIAALLKERDALNARLRELRRDLAIVERG